MSSEKFEEVVRKVVINNAPIRTVALKGKVSRGLIYDMLGGHVPTYGTLVSLAGQLGLSDNDRTRLFSAAGYSSLATGGAAETADELQMRLRGLTPARRRVLNDVLEHPELLDTLADLLRFRRVRLPLSAA